MNYQVKMQHMAGTLSTHALLLLFTLLLLQLLPTDPEGKAAARLIINRFGDKFVPAFYRLLVRQDPTEQSAAAAVLDVELSWLVQHIDPQGPLAMSDQLTLVDCAVAPFLIRLYLLEHYRYAVGWVTGV